MITVNFTDGSMDHKVHTRGEALALIDRYWPNGETHVDQGDHKDPTSVDKINFLLTQVVKECDKQNIPIVYGYTLDGLEFDIAAYGDHIPLIKITNTIHAEIVNELEKKTDIKGRYQLNE
ncbi:hypothetical protein D931_02354 [Enterococcus faecium 13.SD.W.09]|nr:hypothetical protein D931_02354 [Enterococcus faecium 13.SD.W.09]